MSAATPEVPVIDLTHDDMQVASALREACEKTGFFYLTGTGVPDSLLDDVFKLNQALFRLPLEEKQKLVADENNRGWTPFKEETLDPAKQTTGDTKEGFYFGRDIPRDDPESKKPLHGPNQPEEGVFGAGAHTDYGMLTFLKTDDVPGLQIHVEGKWIDVPPKPGCFIINLGDMLERWTNGMYRSTLHRVVNVTGTERFSIACFFEPNFDAHVECLSQCCTADRPAAYPPTTAGQHILDKYAQTHAGYTVQSVQS